MFKDETRIPTFIGLDKFKDHHDFGKLNSSQKVLYSSLQANTYTGSKMISLRYRTGGEDWFDKQFEKNFTDHPNLKHFPELHSFIKELPFEELGRALIFLLEGDTVVTTHQDITYQQLEERKMKSHPHEFIWIRPNHKRKFYIFDSETKKKIYIQGHSVFFNELDYHGSDAQPFATYALRVDGVFTEDFRKHLGLSGSY